MEFKKYLTTLVLPGAMILGSGCGQKAKIPDKLENVVEAVDIIPVEESIPIKKLQDIPEISIEIASWKPEDVTGKVNELSRYLFGNVFMEKACFGEAVSPNNQWWVSEKTPLTLSAGRDRDSQDYIPLAILLNEYESWREDRRKFISKVVLPHHALFDSLNQRIYLLHLGDKKLAGFISEDFLSCKQSVCDNGLVLYSLSGRGLNNGIPDVSILADLKNSRKVVIKSKKEGGIPSHCLYNQLKLSEKGNRLIFQDEKRDRFYLFDSSDLNLVFQGNGRIGRQYKGWTAIESLNYDASAFVIQRRDNYFWMNVEGKEEYMWKGSFDSIVLSPNGNFCVAEKVLFSEEKLIEGLRSFHYGRVAESHSLEIYCHETKKRFQMPRELGTSPGLTIEDNGTLHIFSRTYNYRNGVYHWINEKNKEVVLEGLLIQE